MRGSMGMIRGASLVFLLAGAGVGFAAVYPWMHSRAPELAKPLPVLRQRSESAANDAAQPAPLDPVRVKQLEENIKKNPSDVASLTELGNMQNDHGNFEEAVKWYRQAVALEPKNMDLHNYLGEALFQGNHIEESLAAFKAGLDVSPTNPEALFDYGYVLLMGRKDSAGAIQSWEKLIQTNPSFDQLDRVRQLIDSVRAQSKEDGKGK